MADAAAADALRQGSPSSPILWERIPRSPPATWPTSRASPEFFSSEMDELDLFWSGTGAADDFRPPPPRPTSAGLPTSGPAAAVAAGDIPTSLREHAPERPPPEPPPPPWPPPSTFDIHRDESDDEAGLDELRFEEPSSPALSSTSSGAPSDSDDDSFDAWLGRKGLPPEPPPPPWLSSADLDDSLEAEFERPSPLPPLPTSAVADAAAARAALPWPRQPPPELPYPEPPPPRLRWVLAGYLGPEQEQWPPFPTPAANRSDLERIFNKEKELLRQRMGASYSFDWFVTDFGDDPYLLVDELLDELDPLLSELDEDDSRSLVTSGSSEYPVGLLMKTTPLQPSPWPTPRRPTAPPWTAHLTHRSIHHPDHNVSPPNEPPEEARPVFRFGQQPLVSPLPSPPPRSSPGYFVFPPPVQDTWDLPVPEHPQPHEELLAEPLILCQVRGLWRSGAITKPTYATFANHAHAELQRHRNGVLTEVELHASLLARFSALKLWSPTRRRPRPSGSTKRPRSAGQSQRHDNFCTMGGSGLRTKTRNNCASRRRHRREHRLVVGGLRLRRRGSISIYWAPAASLLDRKRAAKSVAAQAARLAPTTQRLCPARRRRRRKVM